MVQWVQDRLANRPLGGSGTMLARRGREIRSRSSPRENVVLHVTAGRRGYSPPFCSTPYESRRLIPHSSIRREIVMSAFTSHLCPCRGASATSSVVRAGAVLRFCSRSAISVLIPHAPTT